MNQVTDRKNLKASTALTALTRVQRMQIAVDALKALPKDQILKTLYKVEKMTPAYLAAHKTDGTIFAPVVNALNAHGVATDNTMGSVMGNLELSQDDVHHLACYCIEESPTMAADAAATRMDAATRSVAAGKAINGR